MDGEPLRLSQDDLQARGGAAAAPALVRHDQLFDHRLMRGNPQRGARAGIAGRGW